MNLSCLLVIIARSTARKILTHDEHSDSEFALNFAMTVVVSVFHFFCLLLLYLPPVHFR